MSKPQNSSPLQFPKMVAEPVGFSFPAPLSPLKDNSKDPEPVQQAVKYSSGFKMPNAEPSSGSPKIQFRPQLAKASEMQSSSSNVFARIE